MAPEMFCALPQTPTADVFSFALVMLYVLGLLPEARIANFVTGYQDWHDSIRSVAAQYRPEISPMLSECSDNRHTAAQSLKWFSSNSEGSGIFHLRQNIKQLPMKAEVSSRGQHGSTGIVKHEPGETTYKQQLTLAGHSKSKPQMKSKPQRAEADKCQTKPPIRKAASEGLAHKSQQPLWRKKSHPLQVNNSRKQLTPTVLRPPQTGGKGAVKVVPQSEEEGFGSVQDNKTQRRQRPTVNTHFSSSLDYSFQ
jgi:hypothetical protein